MEKSMILTGPFSTSRIFTNYQRVDPAYLIIFVDSVTPFDCYLSACRSGQNLPHGSLRIEATELILLRVRPLTGRTHQRPSCGCSMSGLSSGLEGAKELGVSILDIPYSRGSQGAT